MNTKNKDQKGLDCTYNKRTELFKAIVDLVAKSDLCHDCRTRTLTDMLAAQISEVTMTKSPKDAVILMGKVMYGLGVNHAINIGQVIPIMDLKVDVVTVGKETDETDPKTH